MQTPLPYISNLCPEYLQLRPKGRASIRSIPILLRITQTRAYRNRLIPFCRQALQHILHKHITRLIMNIMTNNQEFIISGIARVNRRIKFILAILDQGWRIVEVVGGIEVEVGYMVAEISHVGITARRSATGGVGWAHVGWDYADDVADCHFEFVHFVFALGGGDIGEIGVGPGMRGYLVTFRVHTFNEGRPC